MLKRSEDRRPADRGRSQAAGLVVLHYDHDFDLIAEITGQLTECAVGGAWELSSTAAHSGVQSSKSATIEDGEASETVIQVPAGARQVRFWYKVSSGEL